MASRESRRFKVIMLGDSGVGKTALVNHVSDGVFNEEHAPTVGSQFLSLPLEYEGEPLTLEVWDTAGQEVYRSLVGYYSREAVGAFLLFDVTNRDTFDSVERWIDFANENAPGAAILLIANKIDMLSTADVTQEMISQLSDRTGLEVFSVSARTGQCVHDPFDRMAEILMLRRSDAEEEQEQGKGVKIDDKQEKKEGYCC